MMNNSEPSQPNLSQPICQGANTRTFSIWKLAFTVFPMTPSCILAEWVHEIFLTNVHFVDDGDNYSLWDVRVVLRYSASRAFLQMALKGNAQFGMNRVLDVSSSHSVSQHLLQDHPVITSLFCQFLSLQFNTKPCYLIPWHDFTLQKRTEASPLARVSVWCMYAAAGNRQEISRLTWRQTPLTAAFWSFDILLVMSDTRKELEGNPWRQNDSEKAENGRLLSLKVFNYELNHSSVEFCIRPRKCWLIFIIRADRSFGYKANYTLMLLFL